MLLAARWHHIAITTGGFHQILLYLLKCQYTEKRFLYSVATLWNQKQTNKKFLIQTVIFYYCENMVVDWIEDDLQKNLMKVLGLVKIPEG